MLRSVKSQIVVATSLIIVAILGATAYFVIDQKAKELRQDIYTRAVSFAELTHERIIRNYEHNYTAQAFANFDREMAEIYSLNADVTEVNIFNYKGEALYLKEASKEPPFSMAVAGELERLQAVWPSVETSEHRIVYLEKMGDGIRAANFNGRDAEPIHNTEQITDIIYPFRDQSNIARSFSIRYVVSYDALGARIRETVINLTGLAVFGVLIALFIGGIMAGRITSPISKLTAGAAKIGKGDLKTRIEVQSKNEIGLLADTFNRMATDLQKSTQELVEKEKQTRELELAGQIQQELLPKALPSLSNLDIAASLHSATAVGGDCYDFLQPDPLPGRPAGKHLLFYVADVTGHGVPAGLVSAISNALVPAFMEHYQNPQDLVIHLNKILKLKTRANMFMTMVMALWDEAKSELSFTQAGHDPILHYQARAKQVRALPTGGMALGMIPDISKVSKTETVAVAKNDVLVFYTDGIPEAWKNEKEQYGMEQFKASIAKHASASDETAQAIHDALLADVQEFMGGYPQQDDITLIVAKRTS